MLTVLFRLSNQTTVDISDMLTSCLFQTDLRHVRQEWRQCDKCGGTEGNIRNSGLLSHPRRSENHSR